MNDDKKYVLRLMAQLFNVWSDLSNAFGELDSNSLDDISIEYPFEKSFDDYTLCILFWKDMLKEKWKSPDFKDILNRVCPASSSRNYIVCNRDGIPYAGQGYGDYGTECGTLQECIDWINRDMKSLSGFDPNDTDYVIKDRRDWRSI